MKISSRVLMIALLATLTATGGLPARAMLDNSYTEGDKISFAFFKLSGLKADFESWALESYTYRKAPETGKQAALAQEIARLKKGLENYSPDDDLIHLRLPAVVAKSMTGQDEDRSVALYLTNLPGPFIPSRLGRIWLAVIPESLDSNIQMNDDEYADLTDALAFNKDGQASATIEIWLKPVDADTKHPMKIGKTQYWPLTAEIGSLLIWSPDGKSIAWKQDADWFVPPDSEGLSALYKD